MASGLSKATHLSYSSGQRCFILLTVRLVNPGNSILPASVITISRFISYLLLSYQPSTVKSYLSAVRSPHIIMGLDRPSVNHPRVQLVLSVCLVIIVVCVDQLHLNYCYFFVKSWTFPVMGTVCTVCSLTLSDCS